MDYENKYGTLSVQEGLLELLKVYHSFCVKNSVCYSLAYGSLLGAIRYKGFIPWDDDLDVFVDRKNYNHLIDAIQSNAELRIERESADSLWVDRVRMKNPKNAKFEPTLDIFVLDNVPDKKVIGKLKLFLILTLQGMLKPSLSINKGSFLLRTCVLLTFCFGLLFPIRIKKNWYRKVSQIGNSKKTKYVSNYNGEFKDLTRLYPSDMMDNIEEYVFEDTTAYILRDYDLCLTTQFGDYMTPPREEDRRPTHGGGNHA